MRYNQGSHYESLLWSMSAIENGVLESEMVDALVLASNNSAKCGLSPRISSALLISAAKFASGSYSEWNVLLGLQTFCSCYGIFARESEFFQKSRLLTPISSIRKRSFSIHLDAQIEWIENHLLQVLCFREYHSFCRGTSACETKLKSNIRLKMVEHKIEELRQLCNQEVEMPVYLCKYWLGMLDLLEGAMFALKRGGWKGKRARASALSGKGTLLKIKSDFPQQHRRKLELKLMSSMLKGGHNLKPAIDGDRVKLVTERIALEEKTHTSYRSVSLLLRLCLLFQLFEDGPYISAGFNTLMMKAKEDLASIPGHWYRSGLVRALHSVLVSGRTCLFRQMEGGMAKLGGNRMAKTLIDTINNQGQLPRGRPNWRELLDMDANLLDCLSVGHHAEVLRNDQNSLLPEPDSDRETD